MATIGTVTKNPSTGAFRGTLQTMSLKAAIAIVPNEDKQAEGQPDFRVVTKTGFELGAGWTRTNRHGEEYVSLSLTAPEFANGRIYANLGRAPGSGEDEETFALIWNPPTRN